MNELYWMILYLFSAIGLWSVLCWLIGRGRARKPLCGYRVIPLHDAPADLEAELREGIAGLRWCGGSEAAVLMVDMGLGEESVAICEKFLAENQGLLYCTADSLPEILRDLEQL